ncbi:MAG: hypothetical protein M1348_00060 [Candidatus Parvarchaeota archaeon]|nr:hypothetical protein [Candidatus Parvarchaeota archaeon]MCL5100993.1 hypothetical protein [Candidatus Parvarchaeota archaeon]
MRVHTLLFLVVVLIFSIGISNASTNSNFALPQGINNTGTAFVNITDSISQSSQTISVSNVEYTFMYVGSGTLNLTIPNYVYGVSLTLDGQPYIFSQVLNSQCSSFAQNTALGCINIVIPNVKSNEIFTLAYSYDTNFAAGSSVFNSTFVFIPFAPTELKMITVLPQGAFLPPNRYAIPNPAVFSTNGQNIAVTWSLFQNTAGAVLPFIVSYESTFPTQTNYNSYILAAIIIMGIILILLSIRHYKQPEKTPTNRKKINPFKSILNADEKRILDTLKRGKFIAQNDLIHITGFSKAKISKIISKLSRYKLVRVQVEGKYNRIKRL